MTQAAAVATPQTEKMLSRKEGSVGYVVFNNPERHNAVSLDMWQMAGEMLDDFRNDNNIKVVVVTGAGGKAFVSGADISRFEKERSNEEAVAHYSKVVEKQLRRLPRVPEARHRHDPRLLHRRRHGARDLLRHPHRHREVDLRGACGQARAGLRLFRIEAAGRRGRAVLRHGDFLYGAAIHRSRGADHGPREPGRSRRRIGKLRAVLRRHDRRQRAA